MTRTFILQRVLASHFSLPDALWPALKREREGAKVTGAAAPDFLQPPWHEVEMEGKVE